MKNAKFSLQSRCSYVTLGRPSESWPGSLVQGEGSVWELCYESYIFSVLTPSNMLLVWSDSRMIDNLKFEVRVGPHSCWQWYCPLQEEEGSSGAITMLVLSGLQSTQRSRAQSTSHQLQWEIEKKLEQLGTRYRINTEELEEIWEKRGEFKKIDDTDEFLYKARENNKLLQK